MLLTKVVFALDLELTQGLHAALPVGVESFGQSEAASSLTSIIRQDFAHSGQFKLIQAMPDSPVTMWRAAGADSVLKGSLVKDSSGKYDVRINLLDTVAGGEKVLNRQFLVSNDELRSLAHYISDLVYEKLTGEKGVFSTRIAYIWVRNFHGSLRYSLEIADSDGSNPQSLLTSSEPIMSPSWSPDGRKIACVSFEKRRSQIFIVNVETGERQLVTSFPGINGAPAWSPDGKSLALVLSKVGNPKIYKVDLANGQMQQLTFGNSIDTEPHFSHDGKSIIFTSGRGGTPQIYRLNLNDGKITRLTFVGNYNARASLTPNQAELVMLHREDGHFSIAVQNIVTGEVNILSDDGNAVDESPSISPNGRMVLYATSKNDKGMLEIASIDGRIHLRLPSKDGNVQEPSWSPFLQ
ncbi:MAG: Tol-Pal system beta propeller repeat protein TolB [Legionellales bacterium RIFCSPHIGHO2_12_FULL_37_14]|nr:MAG: Tol-Pal system beta propeller repeat protein TolB [Legionellales bacterium RIFCSPHIGHO2_12_FULL_37_14]